jgi:hypothetical protein
MTGAVAQHMLLQAEGMEATMVWPSTDAMRAVAQELCSIPGAERWGHSAVSWVMSEGCRFSVILSSRNPPAGGVAMPTVATRALEILKAIGVPQVVDKYDFPGWHMVPCLFLDFDGMTGRDRMDQTLRLTDDISADRSAVKKIVDYVLLAKEKTQEHAGTIDKALDYTSRAKLGHPQYQWFIPVGYRLIGRAKDADTYVEEHLARLRAENNASSTQLYEAFSAELRSV